MRKTTRRILFLGLLVGGLAAAVYAQLVHERALAPALLTALDPATITRIEVRCSACRTRRFERAAAGWRMLEPYALPANGDAVTHLLAVAQASVRTRRPLRGYDLAKLGLDPARITLQLNDLSIGFGDEDPIEHDRYVRIGDELLRVPDRFSARLLETPESELADPTAVHKD